MAEEDCHVDQATGRTYGEMDGWKSHNAVSTKGIKKPDMHWSTVKYHTQVPSPAARIIVEMERSDLAVLVSGLNEMSV